MRKWVQWWISPWLESKFYLNGFNNSDYAVKRWKNKENNQRCGKGTKKINIRWATTWQNQQNECAPSEDSDQTGHPCRDGATASWVINQYFRGVKCLAQGHNMAAVGVEPPTSRSGVRHSTTEPPRSPFFLFVLFSFFKSIRPIATWLSNHNSKIHFFF